ncbi:MAG: hypothetical protein ABSG75_16730 [Syntrophales bacterium]|jgi:hypothetical protein
MSVLMIIVGSLPMQAACSKKNDEGAVEMSKKLTTLYLPNSDNNALMNARECLPAGEAVANPDNILQSALFEGKNHKIASVVRLHDRPLEFIKSQIIGKKAIPSRRLCQILILAVAEKNLILALHGQLYRTPPITGRAR